MSRGVTVSDIVSEIRSLIVEDNEVQLSEELDILPSLNRAQEKAYNVLANSYPEPIMEYVDVEGLTTQEYTLPENIFADRIKKMYWMQGGLGRKVEKCNRATDLDVFSEYECSISEAAPNMYLIFGRKIRFNSPPTGQYKLRIWYLREPDALTLPIADIDGVNGTTEIYITNLNSDYELSDTGLSSYVNIIDGQTGLIKGSVQIRTIDSETVVIKTSPRSTSVLNRSISSSLEGISVVAGDYLAPIKGTCVLQFFDAMHNFIVQYTVAEVKRMLGYAYDVDQQLVNTFQLELSKSFGGREGGMTIKRRNANWNMGRLR